MSFIWLECKDCNSEVEVYCDGDGPMYCPECHSIDNFNEIIESITNEESKSDRLQTIKDRCALLVAHE